MTSYKVKRVTLLLPLAAALILYMNYNNVGGVDAPRYFTLLENGLNYTSWEISNIVSFALINLAVKLCKIFSSTDLSSALIFIIVIIVALHNPKNMAITITALLIACITIPGILLTQNILRQFISTIFIIIAIQHNDKKHKNVYYMLALLSHFSAILFIVNLFISNRNLKYKFIYVIPLYLSALPLTSALGISKYKNAIGLNDNISELLLTMALTATILMAYRIRNSKIWAMQSEQSKLILNFSILNFIAISCLIPAGMPIWILNRLLMTSMFIAIFFYFQIKRKKSTKEFNSIGGFCFDIGFVLYNLILITYHPGALSML